MSEADPRARARQWLSDQLDQLDRLRNANPRDPSFKMWRQNTLTALQRIWPSEAFRSERFRRIPFSPTSARPTGQQMREWFAKGCNEASGLLRSLLEEIDSVGVEAVDESRAPTGPAAPMSADDGEVPMLDLPAADEPGEKLSPGYAMDENEIDLGAPAVPASEEDWHESHIPKVKVELRQPTQPDRAAKSDSAEIEMGEGLRPLDTPAPRAQSPAKEPVREPAKDTARPRAKKPASRSMKLKNMLGFGPSPSGTFPAPAAPAAADVPPAPPVREPDDASAAAEFMRNSPVFGLQGRPVQRASDVTPFQDPDAVALATLAADLSRLGVPEGALEDVREHFGQLAVQIEAGAPEWDRLRAVVSTAMAYPDLARRVMPVLLPWFERAA